MLKVLFVKVVLLLVCLVSFSADLSAQAYAMTFREAENREELVSWLSLCKDEDKNAKHKLVRATCTQYMVALNKRGAGVTSLSNLSQYVSSLIETKCPTGKANLSRLVTNSSGQVVLGSTHWLREFASDEKCLWDNNLRKWMLSLSCGNVIYDDFPAPDPFFQRASVEASQQIEPPRAVAPPTLQENPPRNLPDRLRTDTIVHKVIFTDLNVTGVSTEKRMSSRKKFWWTVAGLTIGGFAGAYIWDQIDKPRITTTGCCGLPPGSGGPVNPPNK